MIQPVIFAINVQFGQIEAFQAYTNTYMEFLSNLSTVTIYETTRGYAKLPTCDPISVFGGSYGVF